MDALPLHVSGVTKTFAHRWRRRPPVTAVDHVSFDIRAGEIFGIIGANGSGKSTLIRMISTLLLPDDGVIRIYGRDVVADAMGVRALINRVSADPSFFSPMSSLENLLFFGQVYGLSTEEVRSRAAAILSRLGVTRHQSRQPMQELSRGQRQKVAVARSFLSSPSLLLLDEPTTGLDPRSKREVQSFIEEARDEGGAAVLLTTHDMDEAGLLCDRMAFLAGGCIVGQGTPQELRERVGVADMTEVFLALTGKSLEEDEETAGDG